MISDLGYSNVLGMPLALWLGITGLIFMALAALLGFMVIRGKAKFTYHKWLAIATLAIGIVHGVLAASAYLGY